MVARALEKWAQGLKPGRLGADPAPQTRRAPHARAVASLRTTSTAAARERLEGARAARPHASLGWTFEPGASSFRTFDSHRRAGIFWCQLIAQIHDLGALYPPTVSF